MRADFKGLRSGMLAGLVLVIATGLLAQSTGSSTTPSNTPTAQPAPGTTPVGGDSPAPPTAQQPSSQGSGSQQPNAGSSAPSSTPSTTSTPNTASKRQYYKSLSAACAGNDSRGKRHASAPALHEHI